MEHKFIAGSSPHIRSKEITSTIMRDVVIALLPATVLGIYFFKLNALIIVITCICFSVGWEYLANLIRKKEITTGDYSAVVTGLLLALNLPPYVPVYIPIIGSFVAIVLVKQLFGGIGYNFINPALAARAFLVVSWTGHMTKWVAPRDVSSSIWVKSSIIDSIASATPLAIAKEGGGELPGLMNMFIGNIGGCIGETSAVALLIGAAYLLIRRVITYEIPLTYIGVTALLTWILGGEGFFQGDFIFHVLAGGLIIGAFYMATDYTTSPVTLKGKFIMGAGCGIITSIIRIYGNMPEGVSFAIILMNLTVPLIERYTAPKVFGGEKQNA